MPNTRGNATSKLLSLSNLKLKRKLAHDDSIRIAKKPGAGLLVNDELGGEQVKV